MVIPWLHEPKYFKSLIGPLAFGISFSQKLVCCFIANIYLMIIIVTAFSSVATTAVLLAHTVLTVVLCWILNKAATTLRLPVDFTFTLEFRLSRPSIDSVNLSSTEGWLTSPLNAIFLVAKRESKRKLLLRSMLLAFPKLGIPVCWLGWDYLIEAAQFSILFIWHTSIPTMS